MSSKRAAVWLERALVLFGSACIGYYGYITLDARQFRNEQRAALEELLSSTPLAPVADAAAVSTPVRTKLPSPEREIARERTAPTAGARLSRVPPRADQMPTDGLIGILDIPRLRISSPIMSGDDDKTLDVAVGHLRDTPLPWERGNSAMAGHRDGLFRPLKDIKVGDTVRVRSSRGHFTYRVRHTRIVTPDDLSVLQPFDTDTLTLITCYPFNYIGAAPRRFIVQAERIDEKE